MRTTFCSTLSPEVVDILARDPEGWEPSIADCGPPQDRDLGVGRARLSDSLDYLLDAEEELNRARRALVAAHADLTIVDAVAAVIAAVEVADDFYGARAAATHSAAALAAAGGSE